MVLPSRRSLVSVWLGAAVVLGGLVLVSEATQGPLDDPDPAHQRPGVLDAGDLPRPAPPVTAALPAPGRRAVIFFQRPEGVARLCRALSEAGLGGGVDMAVVVAGAAGHEAGDCPAGVEVVANPDEALPAGYGLRRPRDGGSPVGYAVVDSSRRVRYHTLDPHPVQLREVETVLRAVP